MILMFSHPVFYLPTTAPDQCSQEALQQLESDRQAVADNALRPDVRKAIQRRRLKERKGLSCEFTLRIFVNLRTEDGDMSSFANPAGKKRSLEFVSSNLLPSDEEDTRGG